MRKNAVKRLDELCGLGFRQPVENLLRFATGFDNARFAQHAQLLRQRRLVNAKRFLQLSNRIFPFCKRAGQHKPRRMRQRLEEFGNLGCPPLHFRARHLVFMGWHSARNRIHHSTPLSIYN